MIGDHNNARWLAIGYADNAWHVIRTCPCHYGERVSVACADEAAAQAVRAKLDGVTAVLGVEA